MKFFYSFAATMVALLVVTAANAEIYKWTDSNGETHYSERKPDVKATVETVIPRNANASAPRPTVAERDDDWANEQTAEAELRGHGGGGRGSRRDCQAELRTSE